MKKFYFFFFIIIFFSIPAAGSADPGSWRFALGYSFLSNVNELKDSYKHLSKDAGDDNSIYNTSFSICFQPYYQFQNGFRAGAGIGPLILLTGDATHVQVPVNMTLGYSFFMDSKISPYVRSGISYPIASGDYYADSLPGFFGGVGFEILNTKPLHIGFEAAYDASEILLDRSSDQSSSEKIKTGEVMLFIYADF
jgi:hypothetical protein